MWTAVRNVFFAKLIRPRLSEDAKYRNAKSVSFKIVRNGNKITVPELTVDGAPNLQATYEGISNGISQYLNDNPKVFPYASNGSDVDYSNFEMQLTFYPTVDGAPEGISAPQG